MADPGKGLLTYTKEEFCDHWVSTKTNGEEKGIVLLLEPTDEFTVKNCPKMVSWRRGIGSPFFGDISRSTAGILVRSYWGLSLVR